MLDAEFTGYASRSPARRPIRIHDRCKGHLIPPIAPVEALAAVSVPQSSNAATLVSSAASRRLPVRHFKPNGPTALSPHSGSRAVSQFAALVESATMHSFAAHSLRRSPDGSLAAITVCLPITWPDRCGTGRLCEGWRTAPRQRDWWLSSGHHGRFLGGGSGYPPV